MLHSIIFVQYFILFLYIYIYYRYLPYLSTPMMIKSLYNLKTYGIYIFYIYKVITFKYMLYYVYHL